MKVVYRLSLLLFYLLMCCIVVSLCFHFKTVCNYDPKFISALNTGNNLDQSCMRAGIAQLVW